MSENITGVIRVGSNSSQMTVEERITHRLKNTPFAELIGDEDAITELVTRVIREALIQPTRSVRQYGGYEEKDSIAIAAAKQAAKEAIGPMVETIKKELLENPDIREAIFVAIAKSLPAAVTGAVTSMIHHVSYNEAITASNDLESRILNAMNNRQ